MNQLQSVYDEQFRVTQLKSSMSDVMVPINDFTMTADTKNFAKIRSAIKVFSQRYSDITSVSYLTDNDKQSLNQIQSLMTEVQSIANDVAGGKISSDQADQVAVIAQNLVLSAQLKLSAIIQAMHVQLKQQAAQRIKQAHIQLYGLLAFIVLIVFLLEFLNRKLLSHAHTLSKVSSNVVESAGDIVEVNKIQANMTEQQTRFMDKVIKGLELIAVSGTKIPLATRKLEKNAVIISSFAKGGANDVATLLDSMQTNREGVESLAMQLSQNNSKIEQVLEVLKQIQNVADEANLLALNASIDGGSSITHEIQQIADHIKAYTDEVRTTLGTIKQSSDTITATSTINQNHIETTAAGFQNTADLLQRIETLSQSNGQSATVIAQAIAQQNARNQKILLVLRHISELLHSSDNKLQAYNDASERLSEASESLQDMT